MDSGPEREDGERELAFCMPSLIAGAPAERDVIFDKSVFLS